MTRGVTQEAWKIDWKVPLAVGRGRAIALPPHLLVALNCEVHGLGKFKVTMWAGGGGDHVTKAKWEAWARAKLCQQTPWRPLG